MKRIILPFILSVFIINLTYAQKAKPLTGFEIDLSADETIESMLIDDVRSNVITGKPIAMYQINAQMIPASPTEEAMQFINQNRPLLGFENINETNLHHHATRSTDVGKVVRYRQYHMGYPVNKNEITISIDPTSKVQFLMNSFATDIELTSTQIDISIAAARAIAFDYLEQPDRIMFEDSRTMIYQNNNGARLAQEITLLCETPRGEWHVFVDAQTGEVFKVEDQAYYYSKETCGHHHHNDPPKKKVKNNTAMATGSAYVFDPDPLSSNMVNYGGGYADNGDANSPELTASRVLVTLNDIEFSGGMYTLRGPYAEIVDFDTPSTGLFSQSSPDFLFDRVDQGFEPANTYYHIDYLMRYINLTLGCDVMPYQYSGGVQYDPHGFQGADNSFYTTGAGRLSFGEGCVDDAEDSDVIHHELGHGLHDWVTSGGLSQVNGLSEGCGDYVAQSYNRSLGYWTPADPQYNWVFNWDGHNECWGGRVTNTTATYPSGLTGSVHADGQIWATCLMALWDIIGQQKMDKIFYEGLGMTNGSSNQNDAANAVYQAALNLDYAYADIVDIHTALEGCGYTLPDLPDDPGTDCPVDEFHTGNLGSQTYIASNSVSSDGLVDNGIVTVFNAGGFIELAPGFEVAAGGDFTAFIKSCAPIFDLSEEEDNSTEKFQISYAMDKEITVHYKLKMEGKHKLYVKNSEGLIVNELVDESSSLAGDHAITFNKSVIETGVYYLILENEEGNQIVEKVLID